MTGHSYWRRVKDGSYPIDMDNYHGGPYVPIIIPEEIQRGVVVHKRVWIKRDLHQLVDSLTASADRSVTPIQNKCEYRSDDNTRDVATDNSNLTFHPSCEVLNVKPNTQEHYDQIVTCFNNLREVIKKAGTDKYGNLNRDLTFKALFTELNKKEQRFMAMVMTSFGEAGILSSFGEQEITTVMKVIDNRTQMAREQKGNKISELDVALEPSQFSMYNANKNHWKEALNTNQKHKWMQRSLKAYINYQSTKFEPKPDVDEMVYYHANFVSPSWSRNAPQLNVMANGQIPDGGPLRYSGKIKHIQHRFFTNTSIKSTNGGPGYRHRKNNWNPLNS